MRRSHLSLNTLFVRLRAIGEQFRQSLFVVPALFVVAAIVLAECLITVDSFFSRQYLPPIFHTTVDNARSLLGIIAGGVITVTGLVLSLSVVAVQLASSQFSPRTLRILYRSRFQQAVMGFMVGVFTYCLLVLRDLSSPFRSGGHAIIPSISIVVALILAVGVGLAILAYVNHIAHLLQVSEIIRQATTDTLGMIHHLARSPDHQNLQDASEEDVYLMPEATYAVRARHSGWVQQINNDALLAAIPEHTSMRLEMRVGLYISRETPLCTIWPPPEDTHQTDTLVNLAIRQGSVRTTQEDIAFGLQQLIDIALRALSPGINDPTTAYEVIVHMGEILQESLSHDLPPAVICGEKDRRLLRANELSHIDFINQAVDQIRIAGANQPAIDIALLQTLGALVHEAIANQSERCVAALHRQARLIVQGARATSLLPEDLGRIHDAAREAGFAPSHLSV